MLAHCVQIGSDFRTTVPKYYKAFHILEILPRLLRSLYLIHYIPVAGSACGKWLSRYSDSLRAGRFGYRIPVGARFSAAVQTGAGAYPASYTMGTGSFPGVKRPRLGVDHPPPSSAEVKERVELYMSPSEPSRPILG
jgi:hypothetical protein